MALIQKRTTGANRAPSAQRFKYQARSAEEVKARANRSIGSRESYLVSEVDFYTPKAGDNNIRILPPTFEGARHYGIDLHLHYGIGPDKSAFLCLDKMRAEACPICEERANAAAEGEEDLAKALRPKQRVLVWVINRGEEGKGPLAWSMPAGLDKDIVNCSIDKSTGEILSVDDPSDKGYDIGFKREGMDERTKYTGIQVARRASPLSDDADQADKWLSFIGEHPLDTLLNFHEYDFVKAAYAGTTAEHKNDASPAAAPAKVPTRRAASPAPAAEAPADEKPTWDQVHALDEDALEGMIGDFQLDASKENFKSEADIQDWVCAQLEIEKPAPAPAAAKSGSWKDRLKNMKK